MFLCINIYLYNINNILLLLLLLVHVINESMIDSKYDFR